MFLAFTRITRIAPHGLLFEASNVRWVNIGPHSAFPMRVLRTVASTKMVKPWRRKLDALLIRGPSPLLPAMAEAFADLPTALLLVADYLAGINDINKPRWIKEIVRLWARWNYRQQMKVAQRSLTFVNSRRLYNELCSRVMNLVETRTTTLTSADFYRREDTCLQRPIRLLYTGRMARAKGLLHIVEALALLVQQDQDVALDLVGWPQKGDPILDEMRSLAQEKGVADRVFYHGYKPAGPELFAYYKQADVYVIASTSIEGFPRTIWEALAHSVPVVATTVGSISFYLHDRQTALLVPPKDCERLAEAIATLIHDGELRRCMIRNGYALASENTLEARTHQMISLIGEWRERLHNEP